MIEGKDLEKMVQVTSKELGINTKEIEKRHNWEEEKKSFIQSVIGPMRMLKDFGFTEDEVKDFRRVAGKYLDKIIFFYLMEKVRKECKNGKEFKEKLDSEWHSPDLLNCLGYISFILLEEFFVRKGGIIFMEES